MACNLSAQLTRADFFYQLIVDTVRLIMQGIQRKVVYVALYEGFAILFASVGLAAMSGAGAGTSTALATASSVIAVLWNLMFNSLFEAWEARQAVRGRSLQRRIAHAIGFEGGLAAVLVPLFAWWLGIGLWEALVFDAALLLFFLVYTFGFNWAFDRVFGLPASAAGAAPQASRGQSPEPAAQQLQVPEPVAANRRR
jgi:uncharacterized membrane protein